MEQWQLEELQKLLETTITEVEPGERVYLSSPTYGTSRYHLINKRFDGVQVEQVHIDEKWGSRVFFCSDEVPALLKTLLTWHLAAAKEERDRAEADEIDLDDESPF